MKVQDGATVYSSAFCIQILLQLGIGGLLVRRGFEQEAHLLHQPQPHHVVAALQPQRLGLAVQHFLAHVVVDQLLALGRAHRVELLAEGARLEGLGLVLQVLQQRSAIHHDVVRIVVALLSPQTPGQIDQRAGGKEMDQRLAQQPAQQRASRP